MAIIVDEENKVVSVENQPDAPRALFKNLPEASTIEGGVADVLVNGTSIVDENGDANIPIMDSNTFGVARPSASYGTRVSSTDGIIRIERAVDSEVKNGNGGYRPLVPEVQHASAFYGLAKAAGDATQAASDNAVGTYTDDAKIAIQKMLGLNPNKWDLIYSNTVTNAEEADITIAADNNNQAFSLDDVIVYVHVPSQENDVHLGTYGSIYFYSSSTRVETAYLGEVTLTTSATRVGAARLIQKDGIMMCDYMQYAISNASVPWASHASVSPGSGGAPFRLQYSPITSVVIPTVLGTVNISVYGRKAVS